MTMRYALFPTLLLGLLMLGCAATPEQAAEQQFPPPNQVRQVYAVQPAPGGVVVIFQRPESSASGETTIGFSYVTQQVSGWLAQSGTAMTGKPMGESRVLYFADVLPSQNNQTVVFGQALDSEATSIEIVFATGETQQKPVVSALFGIVASTSTPPCTLRLLDDAGQELEKIDLAHAAPSAPASLPPVLAKRAQQECP